VQLQSISSLTSDFWTFKNPKGKAPMPILHGRWLLDQSPQLSPTQIIQDVRPVLAEIWSKPGKFSNSFVFLKTSNGLDLNHSMEACQFLISAAFIVFKPDTLNIVTSTQAGDWMDQLLAVGERKSVSFPVMGDGLWLTEQPFSATQIISFCATKWWELPLHAEMQNKLSYLGQRLNRRTTMERPRKAKGWASIFSAARRRKRNLLKNTK
jgi:hypothetical protein